MQKGILIFNNLIWYPPLIHLNGCRKYLNFYEALKYAHKQGLCLPTYYEFLNAFNYGYTFERELYWTSTLLNSKTHECFFSGRNGSAGSINKDCQLAIRLVKVIKRSSK